MKLTVLLILLGLLRVGATENNQAYRITLEMENVATGKAIESVKGQTNLDFFYSNEELNVNRKVSVSCKDASLEDALRQILGEGYSFRLVDNTVVIRPVQQQQAQPKTITVKGIVRDKQNHPMPGVTVLLKGTSVGVSTDVEGRYNLIFPEMKDAVISFSFIGMETKDVKYTGQTELNVVLEEATLEMDEVVVTGIFERKLDSYTGSAATYKTEDLKMIGSQNVLQSLRTLDPSFHITPNNRFGSDPNKLPDVDIRGKTSVVNLREEYAVDPNQPLYILDGFEVPLQTIVDLNMQRIASVTILKDAASTAIYGSRAANGVLVIETKRPQQGTLRVSYAGDFSVSMPDLTDYNMMNAEEKLEFERLTGYYENGNSDIHRFNLKRLYNERLERVKSGVNSYWLNEPVRTGFSHKHNLYVEGGDDAMLYGMGLSYNGTQGIMKQSDRDVLGFNIDLRYRKGKFRFDNKFSLDYTESNNPAQSFSVYVQTNPYYEKDYVGSVPKYLDDQNVYHGEEGVSSYSEIKRSNPLYNASLNYMDGTKEISFRNNFQAEWRPIDGMIARGRVSLSKANSKGEVFKSPFHTDFDETIRTERGSYNKSTTDRWTYDGDVTVTYGKLFAEKHQVNVVGGWNFASTRLVNDAFMAIGFPDDNVPNPAFSNQYANTKPSYSESTTRSTSVYLNANYSYANRYLFDFNFREDGSSVFGTNKRFTSSWSVGLAWNLHNEAFMGDWADMLKLRFSVGNPGNQNFSAYKAYTTYVYNTGLQNLFGMGANVADYGNPDLKWQKTMDYNLGADIALFDSRLKINADFYYKDTDPMLVTTSLATSTGRETFITNLGAQRTKGLSLSTVVTVMNKPAHQFTWNVSLNGRHQKQEYRKIANSLDLMNEELKKTTLQRYRDGGSPTDIWAVRSGGIDPMTGSEVFIKKDGTYTFDYDNNDEVIVGNTEPKLEGVIGTNVYYRGFSVSLYFRYRLGADYFNHELYNRIENITSFTSYNQDKRALYDRWQKPGDHAKYRRISSTVSSDETYPMTDRYVQRENTLSGESISVGYEFGEQKWLKAVRLQNLSLRANMNDIFRCSTIKAERGTDYPFARTVSFSVNMTF